MSTAFLTIADAIVSELKVADAVSEQVHRAYGRHVPEKWVDMVNVEFDGADPQRGAIRGAPVDWTSQFTIECYARSSVNSGDIAVDALVQRVYARMALDPTLGGLVRDVGEPVIRAEFDAMGQKTGWVRMTYPIEHRTRNGSLD